MNQTHLAAFRAVAEAGSFVGGAEQAMVSQPALSLHVSSLERSLKIKLLDRLPRGVRLTAAGALLLDFARQIAATERSAEQALAELAGVTRGVLRIGGSTTVGAYLLPPLVAQFMRAHPAVATELRVANTEVIHRLLLAGELDLAVTEGLAEHPQLAARVVHRDELVLIASPTHPLSGHKRLTLGQLARQRLILREMGSGTRAVVERALLRRGGMPADTMSIGGTEAIKQAVIAGLGVAIVSRLAIGLELAAGKLQILPIRDLTISRPLHLIRVKNRAASPASATFVQLLENKDR